MRLNVVMYQTLSINHLHTTPQQPLHIQQSKAVLMCRTQQISWMQRPNLNTSPLYEAALANACITYPAGEAHLPLPHNIG